MPDREYRSWFTQRYAKETLENWRTRLDNQDDEKPDTAPVDAPKQEQVGP